MNRRQRSVSVAVAESEPVMELMSVSAPVSVAVAESAPIELMSVGCTYIRRGSIIEPIELMSAPISVAVALSEPRIELMSAHVVCCGSRIRTSNGTDVGKHQYPLR